ncbi:hypothetical protein MLD38_035289 [Melastoma candidum]|uniref:Uncharacterized protein n=1 Tax=Melastoma candidum TaxID=119954 RepID=A0ACB9ME87_9MYRT|nr:hypothetical protein MLD38_035289 [Melastoma candidum]
MNSDFGKVCEGSGVLSYKGITSLSPIRISVCEGTDGIEEAAGLVESRFEQPLQRRSGGTVAGGPDDQIRG